MEHYNSMVEAIAAAGLGTPHIIHDKQIHRFTSPDDRPGSNNCWFVSHITAGAFGSWKLGFTQTWSDGKSENNAALLKEIREYQRHRDADMEILRNDAADEARKLWLSASTEVNHQYSVNKRIAPFGARQAGNMLLVRMCYAGRIVNVQRIFQNGKKRFLKSARVTGTYCPIGKIIGQVLITEGFATGCSLHEHTGKPIIVAFNAGNLKPVALAIRKKFPLIKIVVACDNDVETEQKTGVNPGLTKGRAAAAAVGGDVIYPVFDEGQKGLSDYNDFFNAGGKL